MRTTVEVLVPADRTGAFQAALADYYAHRSFPPATAGSTGSDWQRCALRLPRRRVASFYRSFSQWLLASLADPAADRLPELTSDELLTAWEQLPTYERECLRLLCDDWGRPVGWPELKAKLALSGSPSPARDLPFLAAECTRLGRALPVEQVGSGDDAVFCLSLEHVGAVLAAHD